MNCIYKKLVKICNVKESRSHIETLSIDRVINKEHFYEKSMQKLCTKTSPIPLFNFGKQTKIDFFPFHTVLFYGQDYEKQEGLELVTSL